VLDGFEIPNGLANLFGLAATNLPIETPASTFFKLCALSGAFPQAA
jgi:hypothetical protein